MHLTDTCDALQDAYHSPGQATRLHTLSSTVPLPDMASDDEHQVPLHAGTHADGSDRAASLQDNKAMSNGDQVQPTQSDAGSGSGSDDDTASSISGMSGVSSVAPTEVVDDALVATDLLGKAQC